MYKSFKKIIVPLDLSPTSLIALDHAVYLAKHLKSEIHILHITETTTVPNLIRGVFIKSDENAISEPKKAEEKIKQIQEELVSKFGLTVITKNLEGTVYIQVLNYAKEIDADLISMGTHGANGVENFMGGSNTFRVVNSAKCPVLSLHADSGNKGITDIVLPLDSSRDTREKVDDAIYIAKQFGSTIHIVAVTTSNDDMIINRLKIIAKQVETYIQEDKIPTTYEFKIGKNLTDLTLEHATEKHADLIIIMTEQESAKGFLAGPYSQQMINHSSIPILSVHPKEREAEFVNPY